METMMGWGRKTRIEAGFFTKEIDDIEVAQFTVGEVSWTSRGDVESVELQFDRGDTINHEFDAAQNRELRLIAIEVLENPDRHAWLQPTVGNMLAEIAACVLATRDREGLLNRVKGAVAQ